MAPKEKAIELINKYSFLNYKTALSIHEKKQCALIAVDLILYHTEEDSSNIPLYNYYFEVKQEINKL